LYWTCRKGKFRYHIFCIVRHYSKIPVCKPLVGQGTRQSSYTAGELLTEEGRQWYYDAAEDL